MLPGGAGADWRLSPDGHGGVLAALARGGALADMARRGLTQLFYFQVDNPLVPIGDPEFLGYHLLSRLGDVETRDGQAASTCANGVGNVVSRSTAGCKSSNTAICPTRPRPRLPAADGSPRFWAGNTAVHLLDRAFLERVQHDPAGLPLHIARKKVPFISIDGTSPGQRIEPAAPNAVKFVSGFVSRSAAASQVRDRDGSERGRSVRPGEERPRRSDRHRRNRPSGDYRAAHPLAERRRGHVLRRTCQSEISSLSSL